MSVLIKNMEMPKNCKQCRFGREADVAWMDCIPQQVSIMKESVNGIRDPGCPLVEVPVPHGDLIDRGALEADILPEWNGLYVPDNAYSEKLICNAPTVIEADDSEEK